MSTSTFPQHLLSVDDLSDAHLARLMAATRFMAEVREHGAHLDLLKGKVMAALFLEPSTRTRLSFETAMHRLGGGVTTVSGNVSSLEKGESLKDTARVLSSYVDCIVMRHANPGSVAEFAEFSRVPIINAGDGIGEHPSQALLDFYTIDKTHRKVEGLTIGCVGDLRYGRAVHSLIKLLSRYRVHFILISHPLLALPEYGKELIRARGSTFVETDELPSAIPQLDCLYVTRVQRERLVDPSAYEQVKGRYQVNKALLARAQQHLSILHPLPRIDEIAADVDDDERALYFYQVTAGLHLRMALLALMTGCYQGA